MLINAERVMPLYLDQALTQRAEVRAHQICDAGQWSHDGWLASFNGLGHRHIGENLAKGFRNDILANKALMRSPTHRANIEDPKFLHVGIAEIKCNKEKLIVELFSD